MPRIPRLSVPGVPLHIVQRGNNRHAVFFDDSDYFAYLDTLFESAYRYDVSVHAWVCMTNHVHLLVTPQLEGAASRMMQRLGATYTAGINALYRRSGSLWEGRFKSSLVDSEHYVFACYRYIELNPVRAGMVRQPCAYRWSSDEHGTDASSSRVLVGVNSNPFDMPHARECRKVGNGRRGRPKKGLCLDSICKCNSMEQLMRMPEARMKRRSPITSLRPMYSGSTILHKSFAVARVKH